MNSGVLVSMKNKTNCIFKKNIYFVFCLRFFFSKNYNSTRNLFIKAG